MRCVWRLNFNLSVCLPHFPPDPVLPHVLTHAPPAPHRPTRPSPRDRYGALKSLGEKKSAYNEYVQQRKKEEAEEARQRRMQVCCAPRAACCAALRGPRGAGGRAVLSYGCEVPALAPTPVHPTHSTRPQAKEGFLALLGECTELRDSERPKFARARELLEADPRWQVDAGVGVVGWVFFSA